MQIVRTPASDGDLRCIPAPNASVRAAAEPRVVAFQIQYSEFSLRNSFHSTNGEATKAAGTTEAYCPEPRPFPEDE
jgi:hypothetical protein